MARAAKGEGTLFKSESGYRGYVTFGGKRKYFSAKTKAEAAQKKRALLNQRDKGELSAGKVPTVKEWLDHWHKISRHRESTSASYRQYIDLYLAPLHNVRLDKLSIEKLERFYGDLESAGLSGSTRHKVHAILRVSLKQAVWRGHVSRNVAALVQPPSASGEKKKNEALSEADLQALFRAVSGDRYEARWLLSLQIGLRPGEAIALEWSDINWDTGVLHVHQQLQNIKGKGTILVPTPKTKSGDRKIPLPEYLLQLLARRHDEQLREIAEAGESWRPWEFEGRPVSLIFTQLNGQPVRPRLDARNWAKLVSSAGLPPMRRYVARHTAASVMIANDVDIATVAATLGHSNPALTMSVYTHAIDERREALAKKLDALAAPYFAPYDTGLERSTATKRRQNP